MGRLIPEELQNWALFTAGLNANAKEPDAGRALLNFLKSPTAMAVFKTKGLDPAP
jgi:molybdate transport system substrate-binding protein